LWILAGEIIIRKVNRKENPQYSYKQMSMGIIKRCKEKKKKSRKEGIKGDLIRNDKETIRKR